MHVCRPRMSGRIEGEIERLLAVEREVDALLSAARITADEILADAARAREEEEHRLVEALASELAARREELQCHAAAEISRLESEASARVEHYERAVADRLDELAGRIAQVIAGDEVAP